MPNSFYGKKSQPTDRIKTITFKVSQQEKIIIENSCRNLGLTVSSFVRQLCLEKSRIFTNQINQKEALGS